MKRTILASLALALAATSGAALAEQQKEGLYFIADVGTSSMTDASGYLDSVDREEDNNIYALGLGKEFGNNFFAEAAYTKLLDIDFADSTIAGTNENSAFLARIGKVFPWSEQVAFTAHLGAAYVSSETEWTDGVTSGSFDEDSMSALAGIGLNLGLTENLDARVRYERIISVDTGDMGDFHLDNLTAGVAYHW